MVVLARLLRVLPAIAAVMAMAATAIPGHAQKVGVNSAVNPDATGTPPGGATRKLVLGQEVVHNEHVATGPQGQTQILFLDESAMTVGPNADVTIDEFVYDPNTGNGRLAMSATQGVMRFVGGRLSKSPNAVSVNTPVGTLGIRGGVFLLELTRNCPHNAGQAACPLSLEVVFLYGDALSVTGANVTQLITRPGFAVTISGPGATPSKPGPPANDTLQKLLGQFTARAGATGGSTNPPSDAIIAASSIPLDVSSNVAVSDRQAATFAQTTLPQPPSVNAAQSQAILNTAANQSIASDVVSHLQPPPQPVVIDIAGLVKIAPAGSTLGFTDQSAIGRIPYTGTITYPVGAGFANGTATGDAAGLGTIFTLSPLTAGATTQVTGTASTSNNSAAGTAIETADGNFFFTDLVSGGTSAQRVFAFGGVPVAESFFTATSATPQFLAFAIQPDATLGNGSQVQTIPFLPSSLGGTLPNATVSPLFVVNAANTQFGAENNLTNPNVAAPRTLQASLAIDGVAGNQSSALVIATGAFFTSSDTGNVANFNLIRGTFQTSATSPLTHIDSGSATVPDANGNNLFGGNSISGFVIDQNNFNTSENFSLSTAFARSNGPTPNTVNYAFNQPVLAATLPSGVGVIRSALNEQAFFGGLMQFGGGNGSPTSYVFTGDGTLQTNPNNNRLQAIFTGTDPFTSGQSHINTMGLAFGSLSGGNFSRSSFIDNNLFGAGESPTIAAQVNGQNLPTLAQTGSSATTPQLGLVSSGVVNNAAPALPTGVSLCQCQFLQWGYWTGTVPTPLGNNGGTRLDFASINTWIAGTPTVNMPTTGSGTFTGAAIGTIRNGNASYLASGGFTNTYNFGNGTGTVTISNLDGRTYQGAVSAINSAQTYAGAIVGTGSNANLHGTAAGGFFGSGARETGGAFAIHNISGTSYLASGIFAGSR